MAASTSGAIKAYLEAAELGIPIHRDRLPDKDPTYPNIIIHEGIALTPEPAFSQFDDPEGHVSEIVQVDLWERWKDDAGALVESYTLGDQLAQLLRGARLTAAPYHVSGVRLINGPIRLLEQDEGFVRKTYTVEVRRVLERS